MKKLMIAVILLTAVSAGAQQNSFGISLGTGSGMLLQKKLEGGPSTDLNTGLSAGLQYGRKLTDKLHLVTGLNWYHNSVSVTPAFFPDRERITTKHTLNLLYIPVHLKYDLSRYFFVNGGLIGNLDITNHKVITEQSGIGAGLGLGTRFTIVPGFFAELNPYLNFHGLLLTNRDKYPERVLDAGVKLNLLLFKR